MFYAVEHGICFPQNVLESSSSLERTCAQVLFSENMAISSNTLRLSLPSLFIHFSSSCSYIGPPSHPPFLVFILISHPFPHWSGRSRSKNSLGFIPLVRSLGNFLRILDYLLIPLLRRVLNCFLITLQNIMFVNNSSLVARRQYSTRIPCKKGRLSGLKYILECSTFLAHCLLKWLLWAS